MEDKRKIIRMGNILVLFFIVLFSIFQKRGISISLTLIFLIFNTTRLVLINAGKKNHFGERLAIFNFAVIVFFLILGARLTQIQVVKREKFKAMAKQQSYGKYILNGKRGKILDSHGSPLAYDTDIYKVIADPKRLGEYREYKKIVKEINGVKAIKYKDIETRMEDNYKRGKRYLVLIKKVNEAEKDQIDEIKNKYKLRNNEIYYEHTTEREYRSYQSLAPVLGFMGAFNKKLDRRKGAYGIERYYDNYLKPKKIEKRGYFANFRRLLIPTKGNHEKEQKINGNNLILTIDKQIQFILDDELKKKVEEVEPKSAVGIIMEPSTGKILAMASYPRSKDIGFLNNRVIHSQYELGSIFKPLIMAAAFEEGVVDNNSRFNNPDGYIYRYDHKIRDSDKEAIGVISPETIIRESSNVGMSLISEKLDAPVFERYLRGFNLYDRTGIDLFGEIKPKQLPYQKWDGLKKYTMSYGQGIAITPIQMIGALNSVINGGIYYKPYIVDSIVDDKGVLIRKNVPIAKRHVISQETSKEIRRMLKATIENGTGRGTRIQGYETGGKTGTAQISGKGGYLHHEYTASFMGIFPVKNPKYIILITIEKPKADHYYQKFGAGVAGPVFKGVLSRILKYKEITPETVESLETIEDKGSKIDEVPITTLPNFKRGGLRYAILVANKYGIKLNIKGNGRVVKQEPKPGTEIGKIKEITIEMKEEE